MEGTVTFSVSSIPEYLHDSAFYKTLDCSNDGELTLPKRHYKADLIVESDEDLFLVLSTLHFWGEDEIPTEVFDYVLASEQEGNVDIILQRFEDSFKTITVLRVLNHVNRVEWNLTAAIRSQSLCAVKYVLSHGLVSEEPDTWCELAAGQLDLLQHVHEQGGELYDSTVFAAVALGNLASVKYCVEKGVQLRVVHMQHAARLGFLEIMQYLHINSLNSLWSDRITQCAAQCNQLTCLQYAHDNGCPWNTSAYFSAIQHGHFNIVQYLTQQQCPWDTLICAEAAWQGNLQILTYLHEHHCPWDSQTTYRAAMQGHKDCFQYAVEHACEVNTTAITLAAEYGHLPILDWGHRVNVFVPHSAEVCYTAARKGNLEILRFAYERACEMTHLTTQYAAQSGSLECLQFAHRHRCEWREEACDAAAAADYLHCLTYLHENGCKWNKTKIVEIAAKNGSIKCLQYLHTQGCKLTKRALLLALQKDQMETFTYILRSGLYIDEETRQTIKNHPDISPKTILYGCELEQRLQQGHTCVVS